MFLRSEPYKRVASRGKVQEQVEEVSIGSFAAVSVAGVVRYV